MNLTEAKEILKENNYIVEKYDISDNVLQGTVGNIENLARMIDYMTEKLRSNIFRNEETVSKAKENIHDLKTILANLRIVEEQINELKSKF